MNEIIVIRKNDLNDLIDGYVKSTVKSKEAMKIEDVFLNVNQAAEFLNLAKQTLYGLTSNRGIPFFKKGKKLYFRESDLKNWLLSGRKATRDEIKEHGIKHANEKGKKP
jgi:excisionase family DNA binding protein